VKVKVKDVKTPAQGNGLIDRILNVERITQKTSVSLQKKCTRDYYAMLGSYKVTRNAVERLHRLSFNLTSILFRRNSCYGNSAIMVLPPFVTSPKETTTLASRGRKISTREPNLMNPNSWP
jgi:hypothetical protein